MKKKRISRPFAVISAVAAAGIVSGLLPTVRVRGSSMLPTLGDGDIVLCTSIGKLKRGDIAAVRLGDRLVIKRIIGLGGDTVSIDTAGRVSVNGETLDEPYVKDKVCGECDITFPYRVPKGKIFVLGDNRAASTDSRSSTVGCAACGSTVGRAIFRLYPLKRAGRIRKAPCKGGRNYE